MWYEACPKIIFNSRYIFSGVNNYPCLSVNPPDWSLTVARRTSCRKLLMNIFWKRENNFLKLVAVFFINLFRLFFISFNFFAVPCSAPLDVSVDDLNDSSLTIKWKTPEAVGSSGLSGYTVEYCKDGSTCV